MKLLDEILSDYPRVWEYYKHDTGDRGRAPKYAQRYPLPMGTLSMILDFHKWTHATAHLVSETIGLELPNNVKRTEVGPDPVVMFRINWLSIVWTTVEQKQKTLAKTLGDEVGQWHTRIRVKVNDADVYTYEASTLCQGCQHRSVVRMNDRFICVNTACRNILTGEWLTWQVN
tara:strand:+ start:4983 stop:5501 length:519 start_codon:yes stop_codon:yes gene_type:complete